MPGDQPTAIIWSKGLRGGERTASLTSVGMIEASQATQGPEPFVVTGAQRQE